MVSTEPRRTTDVHEVSPSHPPLDHKVSFVPNMSQAGRVGEATVAYVAHPRRCFHHLAEVRRRTRQQRDDTSTVMATKEVACARVAQACVLDRRPRDPGNVLGVRDSGRALYSMTTAALRRNDAGAIDLKMAQHDARPVRRRGRPLVCS